MERKKATTFSLKKTTTSKIARNPTISHQEKPIKESNAPVWREKKATTFSLKKTTTSTIAKNPTISLTRTNVEEGL